MTDRRDNSRHIRARRGSEIVAKSWTTEAAVRMLMNNLDDEVAEDPQSLVVYGGIGRAARNWACYDKIVETLERLEDDQTLLVQSGKPVGVFRTHEDAPRVLIANSNLVPKWATWEMFNELDRKGLMMYGQMTAGSWIYIGTPGHRPGHLRDLRRNGPPALWRRPQGQVDPDRGPRRDGRRAAARGGHGRRPLHRHRSARKAAIEKRLETRYLDRRATSIDEALDIIAHRHRADLASACSAMPPRSCPRWSQRGIRPDALTDQTSAHDPGQRLLPGRLERRQMAWRCASAIPPPSPPPRAIPWPSMSRRCSPSRTMGVPTFDYGNNIRQEAKDEGVAHAFDFPGFVPAYVRPALLPRHRPVPLGRAVAAIPRTSTGPTQG